MQCECGTTLHTYTHGKTSDTLGLLCQPCGHEWLKEEYLTNSGARDKKIIFKGKKYVQHDFDVEKGMGLFQVSSNRTELDSCKQLKPGDHISWHNHIVIYHHAIVVDVNPSQNRLQVVHYGKVKGDDKKIKIVKEWIDFAKPCWEAIRIDYTNDFPPELVLARAESKLGETKYHFLDNNCESFATFCKTGVNESCQAKWLEQKLKEVLKVTGTRVVAELTKVGGALGKEITKDIAEGAVKAAVSKVAVAEVLETVAKASNYVGAGVVIVLESVFLIWDLSQMYSKRKDGSMSKNAFIKEATQRFSQALGSVGLTIGLGLAGSKLGALVGGAIGSFAAPGVGTAAGIYIGSLLGGVIGSIGGRAFGAVLGPAAGKIITTVIKRDDKAVKDIGDVEPGDQLVFCSGLLHPRCHAIVVEVEPPKAIRVIRNTAASGIVEEWELFKQPIYKVMYGEGKSYDPDVVLSRARSKIGQKDYNLLTNNCKHFACWCKKLKKK